MWWDRFEKFFKPHTWKYRKLFVIFFPVTVPLWALCVGLTLLAFIALIIIAHPICWFLAIWKGKEMDW